MSVARSEKISRRRAGKIRMTDTAVRIKRTRKKMIVPLRMIVILGVKKKRKTKQVQTRKKKKRAIRTVTTLIKKVTRIVAKSLISQKMNKG